MITILATARASSYWHRYPNDPEKRSLSVTFEFYDGKYIEDIECVPSDEIVNRSHMVRQRRLAFDIKDGKVIARLPVGNECRRVLTSPTRENDLLLLRETLLSR
jgi:hypothetical protein